MILCGKLLECMDILSSADSILKKNFKIYLTKLPLERPDQTSRFARPDLGPSRLQNYQATTVDPQNLCMLLVMLVELRMK